MKRPRGRTALAKAMRKVKQAERRLRLAEKALLHARERLDRIRAGTLYQVGQLSLFASGTQREAQ
jgi:hypothetical protein